MITVRAARTGLRPEGDEAHLMHPALNAIATHGLPFAQHLLDDLRLKRSGVMFSGCHRIGPVRHTLF